MRITKISKISCGYFLKKILKLKFVGSLLSVRLFSLTLVFFWFTLIYSCAHVDVTSAIIMQPAIAMSS